MSYFTLWSPTRQTSRSESPQSHFLVQFCKLNVCVCFLTESTLSFHGLCHQVLYLVENSLLGLSATSVKGLWYSEPAYHFDHSYMCWWSYQSWQDTLTSRKTALPTASLTRFFPTLRSLMLHRYELPHIAKICSNHLLFVADWYSVFSLLPT